MYLNIIAQILGLGGTYMLFTLYRQKERKKLLSRKRYADFLWGLHYIFLGAWSGAIPNAVGILRETVFIHNDKKWAKSLVWPFVFIAVSWFLAVASQNSILCLLPMCASTLVTVSLWVKNPKMTRILSVPVCVTFIVYDVFVGSYAGIVNEAISLVSIISSFIRNDMIGCSGKQE